MGRFWGYLAAAALCGAALPANADLLARGGTPSGLVISRKAGEEARFIEVADWRSVDVNQDLVAGDVLRTNAQGHLALLFSDRTQVRLGRNTTLVVKQIGGEGGSELQLESGQIWARAERGGEGLTVGTAAAAAAIRGTDWTMSVDGDRTSLIVLEGRVDLSNALGSVSVTRGEAASARIGQAPTKTVIVDPDDREQMLYYLSLRNAFNFMPSSPLASPDMRAARARIGAVPEDRRTVEDWVSLAEVALSYEGRRAASDAATRARALPLSPAQAARLDLVDALIAGAEGRYAEAAALFSKAAPRLDARRRAIAAYGGYFSRSLADPNHSEAPPRLADGGPYAALAAAYTAGFLQNIPAAIELLRQAEARYPDDPTLPAARAQFALLIDDREQVEEAVARALSLDPDDPTALEARGNYRAGLEGDLEGARADLTRAAAIAPGSTTIWNALGLVESARGATREAEAALRRSIELDPQDALSHANLALLYLEQNRVREAKAEIDTAIAADPSFTIALVARGRYHLQTGELDKAVADLLAGTTADPAFSQGLLLLGAAHYDSGDREAADQAFDNAERLDPNDPASAMIRTAIAIDDYQSDRAIISAQQALARTRARGGDYAALSANKDAGSTLNDAFRLQGLEAWGRYYGDAVFDPFGASGYVDQALAGSPNPFANQAEAGTVQAEPYGNDTAFSSFFQGLILDPLMLSGRERGANLFRRPFTEASLGGGFSYSNGEWGWTANADVRSYSATPVPWSLLAQVNARESDDPRPVNDPPSPLLEGAILDTRYELVTGTGYLTAMPSPHDRIVAYVDVRSQDQLFDAQLDPDLVAPGTVVSSDGSATGLASGGAAWSHTFAHRNVATVGAFISDITQDQTRIRAAPQFDPVLGIVDISLEDSQRAAQRSYLLAANHSYGIGEFTFRYGAEGGLLQFENARSTVLSFSDFPALPPITLLEDESESDAWLGRAYFDTLYEVTPTLNLEAGLSGTVIDGDAIETGRVEPRLGVAWSPVEGQWLRAGYLRETEAVGSTTLAPIGVLGLQSLQAPLSTGGYTDTAVARWDAEWTSHLFTAVEYQHQELHDLSIAQPAQLGLIDMAEGRIDRVSATGNLWVGGGLGAFATAAYAETRNLDENSPGFGQDLPFVPDWTGRLGLTYVHPANIKATLAATYVGDRLGSLNGAGLDGYWTADAFLTWEPFDKRFVFDLAAYNLFDERFDVAENTPGWGRTILGTIRARF